MSMQDGHDEQYIPVPLAARKMQVPIGAVRRLMGKGKIGVQRIPGSHPRVNAADVCRIVASSREGAC